MNKYVSFISDEDFLDAVEFVVKSYIVENSVKMIEDELKHGKNTADFIKLIFDVYTKQISLQGWLDSEINRQKDKSRNNKICEFHQKVLGKVPGWQDLKIGSPYGVDLKNDDNTVFIELKNKFNTLNSSSSLATMLKLENIIHEHPNAKAYICYIVEKKYKSKDKIWHVKENRENSDGSKVTIDHCNENIKLVSGYKVYELVTGDRTALKQVYEALPLAINDVLKNKYDLPDFKLSKSDQEILDSYGDYVFNYDD